VRKEDGRDGMRMAGEKRGRLMKKRLVLPEDRGWFVRNEVGW
jgi:hypothetical protein